MVNKARMMRGGGGCRRRPLRRKKKKWMWPRFEAQQHYYLSTYRVQTVQYTQTSKVSWWTFLCTTYNQSQSTSILVFIVQQQPQKRFYQPSPHCLPPRLPATPIEHPILPLYVLLPRTNKGPSRREVGLSTVVLQYAERDLPSADGQDGQGGEREPGENLFT